MDGPERIDRAPLGGAAAAHVPDPARNRRDLQYFTALDGARAVAALGVLLNHVALLSGYTGRHPWIGQYLARAEVGVSIFFVLSGFLLYRPFVVDRLAGVPHRDVSAYARRRFLRIFPAYWVALIIIGFVMQAPGFEGPHSVVAHFFLIHTYDIEQVTGGPVQQSWTLATELSFYIFLPIWAWFIGRRRRPPRQQIRIELVGVGALWAGCILLKLGGLAIGMTDEQYGMVGTWLIFRIDEFALGMLIAVLSAWWAGEGRRVPQWLTTNAATVVLWAGSAFVYWVVCTRVGLPLSPLVTAREAFVMRLLYSFCAALLIAPAVFAAGRGQIARGVLANRTMVWIGLISYGIYLWHEAWQDEWLRLTGEPPLAAGFVGMLVFTTAMSVLSGAASWYLIERQALKLGTRRYRRRRPRGPDDGAGTPQRRGSPASAP